MDVTSLGPSMDVIRLGPYIDVTGLGPSMDVTRLGPLGLGSLTASDGVEAGRASPMLGPISPMSSKRGSPDDADDGLGTAGGRGCGYRP
jgi:hypothetical protein